MLYPYLGRYEEAFRLLEEAKGLALATMKDSTVVVNLVQARGALEYWAYRDIDRTLATLTALPASYDRHRSHDYWRSLAIFKALAGDTATARELLQAHSRDLSPVRREAMDALVAALEGDCARAGTMFEAVSRRDDFPKSAADMLNFSIGRCLLEEKRYAEAIVSLRKVVEREILYGDSAAMVPVAWFALGQAYEGRGDVARAVACYRSLLEIWKDGDDDLPCRREARVRLDQLAQARSM
jgi:tetratricopeptide (TPR) repeat protein